MCSFADIHPSAGHESRWNYHYRPESSLEEGTRSVARVITPTSLREAGLGQAETGRFTVKTPATSALFFARNFKSAEVIARTIGPMNTPSPQKASISEQPDETRQCREPSAAAD